MKEKYSRRGAFQREIEKWCDLVTFDHLYSGSERATGLSGECEGFVIRDLYTGIVHAYPVKDKHSDHVLASLWPFREAEIIQSEPILMVQGSLRQLRSC